MPGRRMRGGSRAKSREPYKPKHKQKMHVRRGDRVRVIRGNHAGAEGTVLHVIREENRVVVDGVNERKKHQRPTEANPDGGIITFPAPIHASNVMLIEPGTGEPTRTRTQIEADGTKERVSVRTGNPIPKSQA